MRPDLTTPLLETRARWPHPQRGPWQLVGHWTEIDGYLECVGIELWKGLERKQDYSTYEKVGDGPAGIAGTDLRLPTAQLLRTLRAQGRRLAEEWRQNQAVALSAAAQGGDATSAAVHRERLKATPDFEGPARRRVTTHDREHFEEVARVYLDALNDRVPPTKAVAKALFLPASTAEKHVQTARRLGLLPPTTRGRASRPSRESR